MDYPPDLLDELARVFARVALDRLLEQVAQEQRHEAHGRLPSGAPSATSGVVEGEVRD